jgi:hypothetical protein
MTLAPPAFIHITACSSSLKLLLYNNTMANKKHSAIIGDVNGRIEEVFSKLNNLHKKQNFAFAIISGNLFSDPESPSEDHDAQISNLISGKIEVGLPTYFSLGTRKLPSQVIEKLEKDDGELCPNLFLLGRKVSMKTAEGFRIVAVGGKYRQGEDEPMNRFEASYSDVDAQALAKEQSGADLLITTDWPFAVRDGARASYSGAEESPRGVQSISDLCTTLKPRYHFSASSGFYEREPFFQAGEPPRSITRFISLAPFGNADKQKWIYAFSLEPASEASAELLKECTASPFINKKRKLESQQSFNSYRYTNGSNGNNQYEYDNRRRKKHHQRQPPPTPDQCFFCLSNQACETHMIGSIGEDSYLAVAKGPLTEQNTYPELGFPGHVLLIPLQHSPTISTIPDKEARRKTEAELQRYRSALHEMIASKARDTANNRSKLGAVTWEISRARGVHVHWQFLPVPIDTIQRGLVEAAFDAEAENLSYPRFAKKASAMAGAGEGDYLKVMIWSETVRQDIVLPIDGSYRFDLQFPRKVLAMLLGLEKRFDWRACAQATAEEEADANRFKEVFKEFDFTFDES